MINQSNIACMEPPTGEIFLLNLRKPICVFFIALFQNN